MTNWNNYINFQSITSKHGNKFCGAPWSSLIFEPSGIVKFCCMATDAGNLREFSSKPADIVNSSLAKAVRKEFLNGRMADRAENASLSVLALEAEGTATEKYCDVCWYQESLYNFPTDNRLSNTEWAKDVIDDLVKNTDSDGYIRNQAPAWLDIVFSNKCNFACMGCEAAYSTTIGKYISAYNIRDGFDSSHSPAQTFDGLDRQRIDSVVKDTNRWNEDDWLLNDVDADEIIDYIIEHRDTITRIHFQGGEPFMMPEVYKTLDRLIEYDLHKEDGINMWAHTNGSVRTYKGVDIIEKYVSKWEHRFQITMSHDGVGSRGEYIRFGYKDKKWLETFNRVVESKCQTGIQHSVNIFNILHQYECLDWYIDNCISVARSNPAGLDLFNFEDSFFMVLNPWGMELFNFSTVVLVPELHEKSVKVLQQCVDRCIKEGIDSSGYAKYLDMLSSTSARTDDAWEDDDMKKQFISTIEEFDKVRGTNFHSTFPELKPLWNYCSV